ncbi:MAG: aminotransferase class I/II-fold pyridoxal phosphate-dependent enzyme [Myxococcota bacterium]
MTTIDLTSHVTPPPGRPRTGAMSTRLIGSEILKIAGEIRELAAKGKALCDLTVGDFSAKEFPIPETLITETIAALRAGHTNYPPSDGVLELRQAVQEYMAREYGVSYPLGSVLICGGARPVLYGAYRALLNEGDGVVYPLPSWNNNHYMVLAGGRGIEVPTSRADGFFPRVEAIKPHLKDARILFINSPLNPAGTLVGKDSLTALCDEVLEENRRREAEGRPNLFFMYDQIYAGLTFGSARHLCPVALRPEVARYTVLIDGISKVFAATGLRVGWGIGPTDVIDRMKAILGHVGAWAPRAEQVATAKLLRQPEVMSEFTVRMRAGVHERLSALHNGIKGLAAAGRPVDAIEPQGAIYLSVQFNLVGKRTPGGTTLESGESIRKYLLEEAGMAIVPFSAFGMHSEPTWFRASVGATNTDSIKALMPRLDAALAALR